MGACLSTLGARNVEPLQCTDLHLCLQQLFLELPLVFLLMLPSASLQLCEVAPLDPIQADEGAVSVVIPHP